MVPYLTPPAPLRLSRQQWRDVFRDAFRGAGRHNLGLISAGCAFFGLLALFPALAAVVALFGLLGNPQGVSTWIDGLSLYAPAPVIDIARDQVERLLHADQSKLALHGAVSIVVALWSAQQGGRSFLRALTIVNERGRRRGFIGRYLAGGAITFGSLLAAIVMIFAFSVAPLWLAPLGTNTELLLQLVRPPILVGIVTVIAMALYRWGPARRAPSWRWVWPGAIVASVVWFVVTAGFSFYVDVFTPWRAVYGVFSGVFVLMLWLFLSSYIFLIGAEINAQLEHICADADPPCDGAKAKPVRAKAGAPAISDA